jgi:hypothetical protein
VFELIRQLMIALLQLVLSVVEQRRARELAAAAACGGAVDGMSEQPELPAEITEPIAEAPQVDRSARTPGVEPAGGPKPARRARVRRLQDPSGPVPARALHVDDRAWPRSRGAGLLWTAGAGFLPVDSKKSVFGGLGFVRPFRYDVEMMADCCGYCGAMGAAGHPSPCLRRSEAASASRRQGEGGSRGFARLARQWPNRPQAIGNLLR